eukprot:g11019.t1
MARPGVPILCVETGEVYPTIYAAAGSIKVTPEAIHQALRKGYKSGGFHWKRAGAEEIAALKETAAV